MKFLVSRPAVVSAVLASLGLGLAGCSSGGARRIDATGTEVITTVDNVDIQDYLAAVDELMDDLLASGVLTESGDDGETFIEISRVKNDTSQVVDTQLITERMAEEIRRSGLAKTFSEDFSSERDEDAQRDRFLNDGAADMPEADYYLTGRISNVAARAGNTRQQAFTFRVSLQDRRRIEEWGANKLIIKQGRRNQVGL